VKLQKVLALAAIALTFSTAVNSLSPAPANAEATPAVAEEPPNFLQAMKATSEGDHGRAIAIYTKLIATIKPSDSLHADALMGRARSYGSQKQHDSAVADCTAVIKQNPKADAAYHLRGMMYSQLEKYDLSLADANKSVEINPKNSDYLIDRAFAYYYTNNKGKAKEDLKAARDILKEKGDEAGVKGVKKIMKAMGV
jgi:tetratricopeptide (TPR) repeat protein